MFASSLGTTVFSILPESRAVTGLTRFVPPSLLWNDESVPVVSFAAGGGVPSARTHLRVRAALRDFSLGGVSQTGVPVAEYGPPRLLFTPPCRLGVPLSVSVIGQPPLSGPCVASSVDFNLLISSLPNSILREINNI